MNGTAPQFDLPEALVATTPPEIRGAGRDDVRLMVFSAPGGPLVHTNFSRIGDFLRPGDALVLNISKTMPYALEAQDQRGQELRVHLSVPHPDGLWSLEVRTPRGLGSAPGPALRPQRLRLAGDGSIDLLAQNLRSPRLWRGRLNLPDSLDAYLDSHGLPIRYIQTSQPLSDYQTVYATEPGSAEMPSAGRPFTRKLLIDLMARGVVLVPVVLHSGVSSFETGELPGEEPFQVSGTSASLINSVRDGGGRVIAVGTTALRALESAGNDDGSTHPAEGYTDLVIGSDRGVRVANGLLTGWHEPGASHLSIIASIAGPEGAGSMYEAALASGYLWHEFGDSCLILR